MTSLRGRLLAAAFLLALFAIGVGAGPLMAIVALAGLIVIAVIWIWPHAGLIGMILTGVGIPMLASSSTTIPVSITQILAMITLISYVHWAVLNRQQPTYAPHMWALIVFGGVVVISVFLAPDKAQSLIGASIYIRALLFAGITAFLGTSWRSVTMIVLALTAAATLSSTLGVAEFAVPGFHIPADDDEQYQRTGSAVSTFSLEENTTLQRVSGGTGNYNWLAYTIALVMPLNLFWWRRSSGLFQQAIVLLITAVQLAALVLTYTRSGFIGLGAAAIYLIIRKRLSAWLPIGFVAIGLLTLPVWAPDRFAERMLSGEYLRQGTSTIRRDFIANGFNMATEKWLFGHGYGQFGPYFLAHSKSQYVPLMQDEIDKGSGSPNEIRPHNLYIDLVVDYGLVGLLSFGLIIAMLFHDLRTVERYGSSDKTELSVVLQASLISFCICGLFGHITIMRLPWVVVGLIAALRRAAIEDANR